MRRPGVPPRREGSIRDRSHSQPQCRMQKELFLRMARAGIEAEWADILRDLGALTEVQTSASLVQSQRPSAER